MQRRAPRPVTPRRLRNQALAYLKRFAAPRAHLRQVLWTKARRAMAVHGGDEAEVAAWLEALLDDLERLGYVDDHRWAEAKARKLRERGLAERMIRQRLAVKGAAAEAIDAALAKTRPQGDPDLDAALTYVRKRRLGPWRPQAERAALWQKDLARLARAGFSYGVAKRALEGEAG